MHLNAALTWQGSGHTFYNSWWLARDHTIALPQRSREDFSKERALSQTTTLTTKLMNKPSKNIILAVLFYRSSLIRGVN